MSDPAAHDAMLARRALVPLLARRTEFGLLFYEHLFERRPDLRPLFQGGLEAQARKLVDMLEVLTGDADRQPELHAALHRLGARHAGYGVHPQDYPDVGAALLWAMARTLGAAFTPEMEGAWTRLYKQLAQVMLGGHETPPEDGQR